MTFSQPATEKQAQKKSNEMEWESSPGGADGQSVAPPGSRLVLHDQQEAVWLAVELLVRPSVRAAEFESRHSHQRAHLAELIWSAKAQTIWHLVGIYFEDLVSLLSSSNVWLVEQ